MNHSWSTHEPLMKGALGEKHISIQSAPFCGTGVWPQKKQKKGKLMNHSWPTHEPLIKGWLYILIHSFIHSCIFHSSIHSLWVPMFFLILGIPKGSFGPLRIYRWISCRIPDQWLSWMICLSITDLRGLFKDVHHSKFFVAPTHEKLMTHSWTTHEWAELLNTHRQIKMMTPTAR